MSDIDSEIPAGMPEFGLVATDSNIVALKPKAPPPFTVEQKLALLMKYEDALCRIADAPERKFSFDDLRRVAAEALGIK